MPASPLPRLKLASMHVPAVMTRASSPNDGSFSALCATHVGGQIVAIPIEGTLRCLPLHRALVGEETRRDCQPLFGSRAYALQACLHAACDQLDFHRTFLAVSHRQLRPYIRPKGLPPSRHRLPRRLRWPSAPLVHRPWGLQIASLNF